MTRTRQDGRMAAAAGGPRAFFATLFEAPQPRRAPEAARRLRAQEEGTEAGAGAATEAGAAAEPDDRSA